MAARLWEFKSPLGHSSAPVKAGVLFVCRLCGIMPVAAPVIQVPGSSLSMKTLSAQGRKFAPALALFVLCLVFFWKMIFTNLIVARGDLFGYFYPYRDYAAAALRDGRLPLWNPYLFMGAPFLANSQAGFFYPFNLALSWLEVTRAVNLNIVLHSWIAAMGAYAFARRLGTSILAAWLGGVSFGWGGYLGAQIEHFNQLQALAWLPWLWLAYETALDRLGQVRVSRSQIASAGDCDAADWQAWGAARIQNGDRWRLLAACAPLCGGGLIVGLMIFAGHAQSLFIALVGLTLYALWPAIEHARNLRRAFITLLTRLAPIAIAVVVGGLLAAVQLLPTVELVGLSPRGSGLPTNEAVSFSLDPRLIGRALLPDYEGALPDGSEFTAFFGVSALLMMSMGLLAGWLPQPPTPQSGAQAAIQPGNAGRKRPPDPAERGAGGPTHRRTLRAVSLVAIFGLFLALGGFNPIYYVLVRFAPGFDLFRAPARWLALFTFAGSMLAAVGLDAMGHGFTRKTRIMTVALPLLLIALLITTTFVGANVTPAGAAGPIGAPGDATLLGWGATCILTLVLIFLRPSSPALEAQRRGFVFRLSSFVLRPLLITLICCIELFLATRNLPYNARLTAPDALTNLRPSLTQLRAGATDTPPARVLSISDILFEPGDSAELASIYADQLPPDAYYDLLIASKHKEIAAPNLPLYYRLPAVDGYDGGLLPLRTYLSLQRLFLPPDAIQSDGRLREQLKSIPAARWLNLMNVKYVITDKVRDQWLDSVFYDLQFVTPLKAGQDVSTDQVPALEANALGIVYSGSTGRRSTLAEVIVDFADGSARTLQLVDAPVEVIGALAVTRLRWDEAKRIAHVTVRGLSDVTLRGAAAIDEQSGTFHSFVLAKDGRFRLAHSGDVKVYDNVDALRVPRAFVVAEARFVANEDEALAVMQSETFDPADTVVFTSAPADPSDTQHATRNMQHATRITHYDPERVVIEVNHDSSGYLVLTDAWYPGWTATVDGEPVEILRADMYFRAVPIVRGAHRVEFRYAPLTVRVGGAISAAAWAIIIMAMAVSIARRRP